MTTSHKTKWQESMIRDQKIKDAIEETRKQKAFIASSSYWGRSTEFRAGYIAALENQIELLEQYIGGLLK